MQKHYLFSFTVEVTPQEDLALNFIAAPTQIVNDLTKPENFLYCEYTDGIISNNLPSGMKLSTFSIKSGQKSLKLLLFFHFPNQNFIFFIQFLKKREFLHNLMSKSLGPTR